MSKNLWDTLREVSKEMSEELRQSERDLVEESLPGFFSQYTLSKTAKQAYNTNLVILFVICMLGGPLIAYVVAVNLGGGSQDVVIPVVSISAFFVLIAYFLILKRYIPASCPQCKRTMQCRTVSGTNSSNPSKTLTINVFRCTKCELGFYSTLYERGPSSTNRPNSGR